MLVNIDAREPVFSLDTHHYITLMPDVYYALVAYIQHYTTEVSGCGFVTRVVHEGGEVEFIVDEVVLPEEQTNTYASTDIDAKVVGSILHKLVKEGRDTSRLRCHWHSHVSMDVFHSSIDKDNYKDLDNGDFLVSLVLNKKGELLGGLHFYKEVKMSIVGVPVYVVVPNSTNAETVVSAGIKKLDEFIEKHKYTYKSYDDETDYYGNKWKKKQIGYDWRTNGKNKKKSYSPTGTDKRSTEADIWDKEYKAKRKKLMGVAYNVKFEECTGQTNAWMCKDCANETECTEYFVNSYDKEAIDGCAS